MPYDYYMWQIDHNRTYAFKWEMFEQVRHMGPRVIPQATEAYRETREPGGSKYAAALALLEADRLKAEDLFHQYLHNQDPVIAADAISHLQLS